MTEVAQLMRIKKLCNEYNMKLVRKNFIKKCEFNEFIEDKKDILLISLISADKGYFICSKNQYGKINLKVYNLENINKTFLNGNLNECPICMTDEVILKYECFICHKSICMRCFISMVESNTVKLNEEIIFIKNVKCPFCNDTEFITRYKYENVMTNMTLIMKNNM